MGVNTADGNFNTVEREGGAATHTLTEAEMPSHTHVQNAHGHNANTAQGSNIINTNRVPNAGTSNFGYGRNVGILANAGTNQNTGGMEAHNNLQPYITRFAWRRTV